MAAKRVAVVTGSNKGIGFAIVRGLCKKFDGDVYLTARDESRGNEAVAALEKEGLKPKYHQLAIDDENSVKTLRDFLVKQYGGLDVLVNNAGIAFGYGATETPAQQAEKTVGINYYATRSVCDILFPILKKHSRVVNMSSSEGKVSHIPSADIRAKFTDPALTREQLDTIIQGYLSDTKAGNHVDKGWSPSTYRMSKIAVTAMTFIQQREFNKKSDQDIIVNAAHPGYVKTDMTSDKADLTADEGAVSSIYCALLPENVNSPKGDLVWNDCTVADWAE